MPFPTLPLVWSNSCLSSDLQPSIYATRQLPPCKIFRSNALLLSEEQSFVAMFAGHIRSSRSSTLTVAAVVFILLFAGLVYNHLGAWDTIPTGPARFVYHPSQVLLATNLTSVAESPLLLHRPPSRSKAPRAQKNNCSTCTLTSYKNLASTLMRPYIAPGAPFPGPKPTRRSGQNRLHNRCASLTWITAHSTSLDKYLAPTL